MRTLSTINIVLALICLVLALLDSQPATLNAESVTDANKLTIRKTVVFTHETIEQSLIFPDNKVIAASRRNAQ